MPRRSSRSYLIPHVLRNLGAGRSTVRYPFGPLEIPPSFRGRVEVDIERCVGCGLCARDCPTGCLEVERLPGGGVRVAHRYDGCATCGQCEESCRQGAIRLTPTFCAGASTRDVLCTEWRREGKRRG